MVDTSSVMESARKRRRVETDLPDTGAHESDLSVTNMWQDVHENYEVNPEANVTIVYNTSAENVRGTQNTFTVCIF